MSGPFTRRLIEHPRRKEPGSQFSFPLVLDDRVRTCGRRLFPFFQSRRRLLFLLPLEATQQAMLFDLGSVTGHRFALNQQAVGLQKGPGVRGIRTLFKRALNDALDPRRYVSFLDTPASNARWALSTVVLVVACHVQTCQSRRQRRGQLGIPLVPELSNWYPFQLLLICETMPWARVLACHPPLTAHWCNRTCRIL